MAIDADLRSGLVDQAGRRKLGVLAVVAWSRRGSCAPAKQPSVEAERPAPRPEPEPAPGVSPLVLELGPGWVEGMEGARPLQDALREMRIRLERELGFRCPGVHVRHGALLPPGGYRISVDEVPAAQGQLPPGSLLVRAPASDVGFLVGRAETVEDPVAGRPLARVPEAARGALELAGMQCVHPAQVLAEHLGTVARRHASALLGLQDVQALLDAMETRTPALVRPALEKVPLPVLTDVLRRLLHEGVSVRNLRAVLETLASPEVEGDGAMLAERCRQSLARWISHRHAPSGPLFAWLVDPALEEMLRTRLPGVGPALEPERVQALLESVAEIVEDGRAVLLASGDVRRPLRALCEGAFPEVAVLAYSELDPRLRVKPLGRLGVGQPAA